MELLIAVVKLATALVALVTAVLVLARTLKQSHSKVVDDACVERNEGR